MGGKGSGRWRKHKKRRLVESCLALGAPDLVRPEVADQAVIAGVLRWDQGGHELGALGFELHLTGAQPVAAFHELHRAGMVESIYQVIPLVSRPWAYGGRRWWFKCPLCGQQVNKLYLPPGEAAFGCRACHELTYRSAQQAHQDEPDAPADIEKRLAEVEAERHQLQRDQARAAGHLDKQQEAELDALLAELNTPD